MAESWRGKEQVTRRKDVRKFLKLVSASRKDVFCDLGCGNGNVCRWSLETVKNSIGIEDHEKRYRKAVKNTKKYNIKILHEDYSNFNTIKKLRKCTIFYSVNTENFDTYQKIEKIANRGSWFISFLFPPYPIKPERYDSIFYAMRTPFDLASSKKQWFGFLCKNGDLSELKKRYSERFNDWKEMLRDLNNDACGFEWVYSKRHR